MSHKSARDIFRAVLDQTRPKGPIIVARLKEAGIDYVTTEARFSSGKVYEDYVLAPEQYEAFTKWMKEWKDKQNQPTPKPKAGEQAAGFPVTELAEWRSSLEEVILEQEARIDGLHKALESMHGTYKALLANLDPQRARELPKAPDLPPRYKYKVVVIGGYQDIIARLEKQFSNIRFVSRYDVNHAAKNGFPNADLVLLMKNNCSHPLQDKANVFYGRDRVNIIEGGSSAAASAVSVWLHEKDKVQV